MIFYILRGAFIFLVASVTMLYTIPFAQEKKYSPWTVVLLLCIALAVSGSVVATDAFTKRKKLAAGSGVFLGLLAGLVAAYALSFVVNLIGIINAPEEMARQAGPTYNLLQGLKVFIGLVTCYVSISLVLQTKDDFRFVIPYVEFAKQIRGNRPVLLDTSVLIDGRVVDIIATKLLQGQLIVPKFVLHELQNIADSPDKLRRSRGRRGLDVLQKLQEATGVDVSIDETEAEGANVDQKLVSLAQALQARVMTNDFNLNKMATVRGIDVVNINDLAKAMRPVVLPGENMRVRVVKPGEAASQGVGYLEDGTMVVIENARALIGHDVELLVTSTLQTSAGRMIFGRCTSPGCEPGAGPNPGHAAGAAVPGGPPPHTTLMADDQPPPNGQNHAPDGPATATPALPSGPGNRTEGGDAAGPRPPYRPASSIRNNPRRSPPR